jgi:hypothetical protein
MTTAVEEEQATVIRNYDAHSSESVDRVETTDTLISGNKCPLVLPVEGAGKDNVAMATIVIENRDTSCDSTSVPGTPLNVNKAVSKEASIGPLDSSSISGTKGRTRDSKLKSDKADSESDATCSATVIENRDAGNTIASSELSDTRSCGYGGTGPRDTEFKKATAIPESISIKRDDQHTSVIASESIDAGNLKTIMAAATHVAKNGSLEITDKGNEEDMKVHRDDDDQKQLQLPKDILFFMRDKQSQTQLKQVNVLAT